QRVRVAGADPVAADLYRRSGARRLRPEEIPAMSRLEIRNLSDRYGADQPPGVDEVSLNLTAGRMLALVGESGSGKSVTALSILRLLPPQAIVQAGAMTLDGKDILHLPEQTLRGLRGGRIGMVFQEPLSALNPL